MEMVPEPASPGEDRAAEIASLALKLQETQQRLQELTGGETDAVLSAGGKSYLLQDAQEKLRQSEERFRNMFTAAATGIAVSTPQGRFLHVNAAYCQMLGYTEEELLELNFAALTHPDDLNLNLELRDELLAGQRESFVMEKRYFKKSGEIVWTRHSVSATHGAGGEIATLMVIAEDITERKQVSEDLQRCHIELQVLFDLMPAMICFKDTQNAILRVNRRLAESIGKTIAEIEGKSAAEIFPQEAAKYYEDDLEVIRSGTPKLGIIEQLQGAERKVLWVQTDKVPVFDRDGKVAGIVVMVQDVTDRKQAEAALRYSEERLRLITNLVPHGIFAKDSAGRHLFANPALAEMAGLSVEEMIGKDDFALVASRAEAEAYRADDRAVMQSGSRMVISEEPRTDLSGRTRFLQTIKIPFTVPETGEPAVLGVCMDITERKRADESLKLFRTLVDGSPDAIEVIDPETGRFLDVNSTGCARLGYSREEMLSLTLADIDVEKDYRALWPLVVEEIKKAGSGAIIGRHRRKDGSTFPVEVNSRYLDLGRGYMVAVVRDITERKLVEARLSRLNRLHIVLSKVGEAILRTRDRQELYDIVCRIVVEDGGLRLAFIAELDAGAGVARPLASCGEGRDDLCHPSNGIPIDVDHLSQCTVGTALRTGIPDFCNDLAGAARMTPWHAASLRYGLRANASFPFQLRGTTLGVIVLFAGDTGYFQDDVMRLMVTVANDVSLALETLEKERQRKLADDALRDSEERFRGTFEQAAVGVAHVSVEGRFQRVNDKLCEIVGYRQEEMLSMSFVELTVPEDREKSLKARLSMLAGVCPSYSIEKRYRRKDGVVIWVNLVTTLQRDATGQPTYSISVFQDISERKRNEARFHRLVDSNAQSVFFWNANGSINECNDAFLGLVGYTRQELKARQLRWGEITPPEFADRDRQAQDEIAATGVCKSYEKEFIRKDGSRVPVLIGTATFEDNPNDGVSFVLDLTERKKLEAQFLRAQRMESIGTLAGGIAHDLNNILAPILMSIDVLKLNVTDPQTASILETIGVSAQRGADIVRQVLSFARGIEGERIEVQPKHLLKDLEHIIRDTFPKDIRLHFSIPRDTWTLMGDPTQIHQILLNLCVNARDAMPNGGNLTIAAENCVFDEQYVAMNLQARPGRYVKISVTDSGIGIPPSVLDKIFEPFFTTKELNKGTGLGLSTVMAIVKSHDGIVNVYSEPGKGTTFKVYLPALATPSVAQGKLTQSIDLPRGNGETVLIVDDEASVLSITGKTLQAFGYRVLTAANGANAIAVYAEHKNQIAVVLTDMMMPIMDGPATIQALRQLNPAVKIVAASGLAANGSGNKSPGHNIKYFLTKPYTAGTLLKTLRSILEEA